MIESVTKLSHKSEWETPQEVFEYIEENYVREKIEVDLCANKSNAKCSFFISKEDDLFANSKLFANTTCFMNPLS